MNFQQFETDEQMRSRLIAENNYSQKCQAELNQALIENGRYVMIYKDGDYQVFDCNWIVDNETVLPVDWQPHRAALNELNDLGYGWRYEQ